MASVALVEELSSLVFVAVICATARRLDATYRRKNDDCIYDVREFDTAESARRVVFRCRASRCFRCGLAAPLPIWRSHSSGCGFGDAVVSVSGSALGRAASSRLRRRCKLAVRRIVSTRENPASGGRRLMSRFCAGCHAVKAATRLRTTVVGGVQLTTDSTHSTTQQLRHSLTHTHTHTRTWLFPIVAPDNGDATQKGVSY